MVYKYKPSFIAMIMLLSLKSRKLKFSSGAVSTNLSTKSPIYLGQRCKKSLPQSTLGPRRGEKSNLCIFCGTAMPQRISFPTVHLSLFHWRLLFLALPPPHSTPQAPQPFFKTSSIADKVKRPLLISGLYATFAASF